jgi:8-oxo-dGTP diphosphatase
MGKSDQGVQASADRYRVIPRVLVFVLDSPTHPQHVLLLKGAATKRIWANRYNGVGGHVEAGEDVYTAARRETHEETGLRVRGLSLRGVVNIDTGQEAGIMLFAFCAHTPEREVRASHEGALEWVPLDRLSDYDLVEDLPALLERIVAPGAGDAGPFFARYHYDEDDRLRITFAR